MCLGHDELEHGGEVRGAVAGGRVPAVGRGEARADAGVVGAGGDVVEDAGRAGDRVDPRVEEAHRGLAGGEEVVVELSDHAREHRARSRGAANLHEMARRRDAVAVGGAGERGDVRVAAAGGVVHARVRQLDRRGEVGLDRGALVVRGGEGVGEAAATVLPRGLVTDGRFGGELGAAHRGDVRRAGGEVRVEDGAGMARAAPDALVSRREEEGEAARAAHHELGVALVHVLVARLLDLVVAVAHRLHEGRVVVVVEGLGPVEERVRDRVDHSKRDRGRDRLDVLHVEQGLHARLEAAARTLDGVNGYMIHAARGGERGEVVVVDALELELGHGHAVALGGRREGGVKVARREHRRGGGA
mmetsp:Transcript_72577/g.206676  ORF Transcript_72577/g.206676 Transcript_72577/m.206676 type:complete len:359 (-) Transcript_72577:702-1778(-)